MNHKQTHLSVLADRIECIRKDNPRLWVTGSYSFEARQLQLMSGGLETTRVILMRHGESLEASALQISMCWLLASSAGWIGPGIDRTHEAFAVLALNAESAICETDAHLLSEALANIHSSKGLTVDAETQEVVHFISRGAFVIRVPGLLARECHEVIKSVAQEFRRTKEFSTLAKGQQAGVNQLASGQGFSPDSALCGPGYEMRSLLTSMGFHIRSRKSNADTNGVITDCYLVQVAQGEIHVFVRMNDPGSNAMRSLVENALESEADKVRSTRSGCATVFSIFVVLTMAVACFVIF